METSESTANMRGHKTFSDHCRISFAFLRTLAGTVLLAFGTSIAGFFFSFVAFGFALLVRQERGWDAPLIKGSVFATGGLIVWVLGWLLLPRRIHSGLETSRCLFDRKKVFAILAITLLNVYWLAMEQLAASLFIRSLFEITLSVDNERLLLCVLGIPTLLLGSCSVAAGILSLFRQAIQGSCGGSLSKNSGDPADLFYGHDFLWAGLSLSIVSFVMPVVATIPAIAFSTIGIWRLRGTNGMLVVVGLFSIGLSVLLAVLACVAFVTFVVLHIPH